MKPTIGRIVHYVYGEAEHRPAIIVHVWSPETVQLQVFNDTDPQGRANDARPQVDWQTSVPQDEDEKAPGTWHWPERVDA